MLHIDSLEEGLPIFKVLGSELRVDILQQLLRQPGINARELSEKLHISGATLSVHLDKLERCGLIYTSLSPGKRGMQKGCFVSPDLDSMLIRLRVRHPSHTLQTEIPVGQFTDFDVKPTCGLSTTDSIIGPLDSPRYFAHPDRAKAGVLWFAAGHVEFMLPNFVPRDGVVDQLEISFEISSEAPGIREDWPSDISFFLEGVWLGDWRCPGDFGAVRGRYNPEWWHPLMNQYGLLRRLVITRNGTFLEGHRIGDVTIDRFDFQHSCAMRFRLAVQETAECVGGLTLFGRGFGNHNQGIIVRTTYSDAEED